MKKSKQLVCHIDRGGCARECADKITIICTPKTNLRYFDFIQ